MVDFIQNMPLYIETEKFIIVHGGIIPWKKIDKHEIDEITRLREYKWKPWHNYYTEDKKIIYGHWAAQWLHITDNTIWLDTGCVYWKELSAYILETGEIIQQQALMQYSAISYQTLLNNYK